MKIGKSLTRNEMKNIKAGGDGCLYCYTPWGTGCWYRTDLPDPGELEEGEDPYTDTCGVIYPAFEGEGVSGMYDSGCSSQDDCNSEN